MLPQLTNKLTMNNHDYDKILTAIAKAILGFLVALAVCAMLPSCKRVEYVAIPEYHTDTLRTIQLQKDSVYLRDSVYVTRELRGDTLYMTIQKVKYEYRDRLHVDTAYISKTDSVPVIKEVEKPLSKWQQFKLNIGGGAVFAASALLLLLMWRITVK